MTTPWSFMFVYSDEDEHSNNEESCTLPSHHDAKNNGGLLSASRPLLYTITMSSGSSGADTFSSMSESDGISSSEPSTRAGTPPETPAADTGSRTLRTLPTNICQIVSKDRIVASSARFISPTSSRQDVGYEAETESSFSRLMLSSVVPKDSTEQGSVVPLSIWARRNEAARGRALGRDEDGPRSYSRKRGSTRIRHQSPGQQRTPELSLAFKPSLERSQRPLPLDLSAVSCARVLTCERDIAYSESPCNEGTSPDSPVTRLHTAPLALRSNSDMKRSELPQPPTTAPFLTMPKAPLIRPSVVAFQRTPSPLMLPSPYLSWTLNSGSQPTTASTTSTLWSPTSPPPPSTLSPSGKREFAPRGRASLGQKIAHLRKTSASGPIPPSLKNSPILNSLASPRFPPDSPDLYSHYSPFEVGVLSPPSTHFVSTVGTPLRVHMNLYFSEGILAGNLEKEPSGTGICSYFATPSMCGENE